jgi:hypothetical protein
MTTAKEIFCFSLFITLLGCSPKVLPTAETTYQSSEEAGTIVLNSTGYFKGNLDQTTFVAEKQAFETLLFRGIPGSQVPNALLGVNEKEVKDKNQKFFKEFYDGKRYRTFVMYSENLESKKSKGFRYVKLKIKINVSSLTQDLEAQGVKRAFGL